MWAVTCAYGQASPTDVIRMAADASWLSAQGTQVGVLCSGRELRITQEVLARMEQMQTTEQMCSEQVDAYYSSTRPRRRKGGSSSTASLVVNADAGLVTGTANVSVGRLASAMSNRFAMEPAEVELGAVSRPIRWRALVIGSTSGEQSL